MRIENSNVRIFLGRLCCLVLLLASSHFLFAQAGRGAISGLVADSTGAIIPGAAVTLKDTATGAQRGAKSTAAGLYSFISLAPGRY
jgi:hypothetical protein